MHAHVGVLKARQVLGGKGPMKGMELHGFCRAKTCVGAGRCMISWPHRLSTAHEAQTCTCPVFPPLLPHGQRQHNFKLSRREHARSIVSRSDGAHNMFTRSDAKS